MLPQAKACQAKVLLQQKKNTHAAAG